MADDREPPKPATEPRAASLAAQLAVATGNPVQVDRDADRTRLEVLLPAQLTNPRRETIALAVGSADRAGQISDGTSTRIWAEITHPMPQVCDHCQRPTSQPIAVRIHHGDSGAGHTTYACPAHAGRYPQEPDLLETPSAWERARYIRDLSRRSG